MLSLLLRTPTSSRHILCSAYRRTFHWKHARQQEESQTYRARKTSSLNPTLLILGFVPVFTFALGTWQIQRLKWKVNLIDELQEKLQRAPMLLPGRIDLSALRDFTFRKVLLHGYWDHAHTIFIGPRVHDGAKGCHVVTPLRRRDGTTVLVDRGFITQEFADPALWTDPKIQTGDKEVTLFGMLRTNQTRNNFTPDNKPERGEWYWVDVDALAKQAGGEAAGVQPVYVEQIFEGHSGDAQTALSLGIPIGRAPSIELRNQHATYAVTWYSLSAVTGFMFVHLLRRRMRSSTARMPR